MCVVRVPILRRLHVRSCDALYSFQNVMRRAVTPDTWNLVRDTSPWQHLVGNENAALLSRANTLLRRDDVARDMRIEGGMQLLPEALMDEYLAADKHHR